MGKRMVQSCIIICIHKDLDIWMHGYIVKRPEKLRIVIIQRKGAETSWWEDTTNLLHVILHSLIS